MIPTPSEDISETYANLIERETQWRQTFTLSKCFKRNNSRFAQTSPVLPILLILMFLAQVGTALDTCSWYKQFLKSGLYTVPEVGCKLPKQIAVTGDMTISGEIGSYRELQANPDPNKPTDESRHFSVTYDHTLRLNFLKLTGGIIDSNTPGGGCIFMSVGSLSINAVHFHGSSIVHAKNGGAIYAHKNVKSITITDSTFESFGVTDSGGALYIHGTSIELSIASTTFSDNWADVGSLQTINYNCFVLIYDCRNRMVLVLGDNSFRLSIDNFLLFSSLLILFYMYHRKMVALYTYNPQL